VQRRVSAPGPATPLSARGPRCMGSSPKDGALASARGAPALPTRRTWQTKKAAVWMTGPSSISMKLGVIPQGLQVVEANCPRGFKPVPEEEAKVWVAIEPKGYIHIEDLKELGRANMDGLEQALTPEKQQEILAMREEFVTLREERCKMREERDQLQREIEQGKAELKSQSDQKTLMEQKLSRCRECIEHCVQEIDTFYDMAPILDRDQADQQAAALQEQGIVAADLLQSLADPDISIFEDEQDEDAENKPPASTNEGAAASGQIDPKARIPRLSLTAIKPDQTKDLAASAAASRPVLQSLQLLR